MSKETLCMPKARLETLLRNWLAGSKPVVSISRDATVPPPFMKRRKELLRIFGPEFIRLLMNKLTPRQARLKTAWSAVFFKIKKLRRQPRNIENVILVLRWRKHWRYLWWMNSLQGVSTHKNSLASRLYHCSSWVALFFSRIWQVFFQMFKWSGYRLAHIFADGSSKASLKPNRTQLVGGAHRDITFKFLVLQRH